jgi:DNA-binding HxlR family transcriptional regulator
MLSRSDHRVLCYIYGGATDIARLTRETQLSEHSLTRQLRRLEREGFVLVFDTRMVALTELGIDHVKQPFPLG